MRLSQHVAADKPLKKKLDEAVQTCKAANAQEGLFGGQMRKYTPVDDQGHSLPNEHKNAQADARHVTWAFMECFGEFVTNASAKLQGNCSARADVVVDGETVAADVPIEVLLMFERQLAVLRDYLASLPVLPATEEWTYDPAKSMYTTEWADTLRTTKVPTPIVLYPATDHHPAQTELTQKDVVVGKFRTQKFNSAYKRDEVVAAVRRCEAMALAVKRAREEANSSRVEVADLHSEMIAHVLKGLGTD